MFIRVEDMRQYQGLTQAVKGRPEQAKGKEATPRDSDRRRERKPPRFTHYAALNAPKSRILDEVLQAELIPPPRKFQNPPNADLSKYCRYHRNNGHTTEECETLKDKIEELIRAGHLTHFVRSTGGDVPRRTHYRPQYRMPEVQEHQRPERREPRRDDRRSPTAERHRGQQAQEDRRQDDRPPLRGTINTISGGFAGGGNSSSSRKRHLRAVHSVHISTGRSWKKMPPITFTDADFKGVDPKQDDPMVVTVEVENFAVKKVLVDQGSSVDILYWGTYQKLQLSEEDLRPYDEPIYGFS